MADKKRSKRSKRTTDDEHGGATPERDFADEDYAAGEPERIRDMQRAQQQPPRDPDEFVTDAEMEVREADSSPQDEDDV
jgi:hypothetical protein